MNIMRHAAVANGQWSHVEMEYTALLYFILYPLVLLVVNSDSHQKIRIKSSNLSISCDDRAGQLKHRL